MANRGFGTHEVASILSNYSDMSMDVDDDDDSDIMDVDLVTSDDNDSGESDKNNDEDDESDTDTPVIDGGWRIWLPNDVNFPHLPFSAQNVGPNIGGIPQSELDSFQNFMSDDILMQIVEATNAYAVIHLNNKSLTNSSIWYRWKDIILPELKAYLGILLKMAIVEKSDVKYYFSKEWTEYYPFFWMFFLQIHWMLHVKSPEPTTGVVTRSSKISNVVEYIQQKCLLNFTPRQNIAVDESTVGFKGRIAFKT